MEYKTTFEDKYMAPGVVLYREDYKQFMKIMPVRTIDDTYTFFVSDDVLDDPKKSERQINFIFEDGTVHADMLKDILASLRGVIQYSAYSSIEGKNRLYLSKEGTKTKLAFVKDLRFSRNLDYNAMSITLNGDIIKTLYEDLKMEALKSNEDKAKVLEKMIDLKPISKV